MDKVIRDGKVAVLYSPGYGAGWSTWNDCPECLFDPDIVALVESGVSEEAISEKAKEKWSGNNSCFYSGGARDLTIEWIPEGTQFIVHEYDGSESIRYIEDICHTA